MTAWQHLATLIAASRVGPKPSRAGAEPLSPQGQCGPAVPEPRRRRSQRLGAQEHPPAPDELHGGAASAQLHAPGRSGADSSQKRQRGGSGGGAAQFTAEQVAARRAAWTARQATPAVAALAAARAALPIAPFRQPHPWPPRPARPLP
jgi:hypothetical protein